MSASLSCVPSFYAPEGSDGHGVRICDEKIDNDTLDPFPCHSGRKESHRGRLYVGIYGSSGHGRGFLAVSLPVANGDSEKEVESLRGKAEGLVREQTGTDRGPSGISDYQSFTNGHRSLSRPTKRETIWYVT